MTKPTTLLHLLCRCQPALLFSGFVLLPIAGLANIETGLVARYSLDGNARDSTTNANHAIVNGATLTADRFGQADSAYFFNGIDQGLVAPNSPSLNICGNHSLSIAAWIKSEAVDQARHSIVWKWGPRAEEDDQFSLCLNFSKIQFMLSTPSTELYSQSVVSTGVWHHVAAVYDAAASQSRVYVDGRLDNQRTLSHSIRYTDEPLSIGQSDCSYCPHFYGAIDEVRMYNRALSSADVAELFNAQPTPCIPHAATATAVLVNGFVVGLNLIDGGCGYTNPPTVSISGGGGSGALATATINNGVVTHLTVTNAGFGYTNAPQVRVSSPPFMPWLDITVSKVKVTQHLMLGKRYLLEASPDLINWSQIGLPFTAEAEICEREFDVVESGRFFRIREIP